MCRKRYDIDKSADLSNLFVSLISALVIEKVDLCYEVVYRSQKMSNIAIFTSIINVIELLLCICVLSSHVLCTKSTIIKLCTHVVRLMDNVIRHNFHPKQ